MSHVSMSAELRAILDAELARGNTVVADEEWDNRYTPPDRMVRLSQPFGQLWGRVRQPDGGEAEGADAAPPPHRLCYSELPERDSYWDGRVTLSAPPASEQERERMFAAARLEGRLLPPEKWAPPILPGSWHLYQGGEAGSAAGAAEPSGRTAAPGPVARASHGQVVVAAVAWGLLAAWVAAGLGLFGSGGQTVAIVLLVVLPLGVAAMVYDSVRGGERVGSAAAGIAGGVAELLSAGRTHRRRVRARFETWRREAEAAAEAGRLDEAARRLLGDFSTLLHDSSAGEPWFATLAELYARRARMLGSRGDDEAAHCARDSASYWTTVERSRGSAVRGTANDQAA